MVQKVRPLFIAKIQSNSRMHCATFTLCDPKSTLYFFLLTPNSKHIFKGGVSWASAVREGSGKAEQWNLKRGQLTNASYLCGWPLQGSVFPELCSLFWWTGLGFFFPPPLEYVVHILSHSAVWKNWGEPARDLVCSLSLCHFYSSRSFQRGGSSWSQAAVVGSWPSSLSGCVDWGFSVLSPLQLLKNKVFANHHPPHFHSPKSDLGRVGILFGGLD